MLVRKKRYKQMEMERDFWRRKFFENDKKWQKFATVLVEILFESDEKTRKEMILNFRETING